MRRLTSNTPSMSACMAILAALAPLGASAQGDPIRIGIVSAKQGAFAEGGLAAGNGAKLAVEQAGQGVLGRAIELLWLDEPNPQTAQQNMSKLVSEDKVVGVIGGSNSASALAMGAVALRTKVPFIATNAAARELTGKDCNRYTFRTQLTAAVGSRSVAPFLLEQGKKWYFLTASYAFGKDIYNSTKPLLLAAQGTEVAYDQVPIGTTDFSSYILKIRQSKPDVLVAGMGGIDLNNLLKQLPEYGMKDKPVVSAPVVSDHAMWAVGPEAAGGIYAKHWHYSDPKNTDEEKKFVATWQSRYNKPPPIEAWQGWMSARMLMAAIQSAKSTESAAIVRSLEKLKMPGEMRGYYRDWDHQFVYPVLVMKGRAPTGSDKFDMFEIVRRMPAKASDLDALYGDKAEVGCAMGPL